jgi:hypothetical protein
MLTGYEDGSAKSQRLLMLLLGCLFFLLDTRTTAVAVAVADWVPAPLLSIVDDFEASILVVAAALLTVCCDRRAVVLVEGCWVMERNIMGRRAFSIMAGYKYNSLEKEKKEEEADAKS